MHFSAQAALSFMPALLEQAVSSTKPLNSAAIPQTARPKLIATSAVIFFMVISPFSRAPFGCDYYTSKEDLVVGGWDGIAQKTSQNRRSEAGAPSAAAVSNAWRASS